MTLLRFVGILTCLKEQQETPKSIRIWWPALFRPVMQNVESSAENAGDRIGGEKLKSGKI